MTSELAKLLDGEVAARFGRAHGNNGAELFLREGGEVWCSDTHEPHYLDGCCEPDSWTYNHDRISIDCATADALWLAHLLAVCKQSGRCASFIWQPELSGVMSRIETWVADPKDAECGGHWEDVSHSVNDTNLEALARAMLAVPETYPSDQGRPNICGLFSDIGCAKSRIICAVCGKSPEITPQPPPAQD